MRALALRSWTARHCSLPLFTQHQGEITARATTRLPGSVHLRSSILSSQEPPRLVSQWHGIQYCNPLATSTASCSYSPSLQMRNRTLEWQMSLAIMRQPLTTEAELQRSCSAEIFSGDHSTVARRRPQGKGKGAARCTRRRGEVTFHSPPAQSSEARDEATGQTPGATWIHTGATAGKRWVCVTHVRVL
jgi:hypothetical protein